MSNNRNYITMTHEQIKSAFNDMYNNFYLKHRNKDNHIRTDEEWEELLKEAKELQSKYNGTLARTIMIAILGEFEAEAINQK